MFKKILPSSCEYPLGMTPASPSDEHSSADTSLQADKKSTSSSVLHSSGSEIINKPGASIQRELLNQFVPQKGHSLIRTNSADGKSDQPTGPLRPQLRRRLPTRPAGTPVLCYDRSPLEAAQDWRFRSTSHLSTLDVSVNKKGLEDLRLSGSASFSSREQVKHIQRIAQGRPVIVMDLRQETHTIVNNAYPVTSMLPNDWANVGKTHDEVLADEADLISSLSKEKEVTLLRYNDIKKNVVPPHSVTLRNPAALGEMEMVESTGAAYVRFTITDHLRPSEEDVDRFVTVVQSMPDNAWLHVHCKGGKGRTTTAMVMYDMLHNAKAVSAEDIIHRHKVLGPGVDLLATGGREDFRDFHQDRKEFLLEFYEYAKENPMGYPQCWSEWRYLSGDN